MLQNKHLSILQEVEVCVGVARRRHRFGRVGDRTSGQQRSFVCK
ncbi:hypothetical protein [Nostoc edaphicum]|nr:hypothetical protein [Nostoc edaphicum]